MDRSCTNCRRAKRKCDRLSPACSLCLKKGKQCIYEVVDGRKPATRDYTKALLARIESLETSLNSIESRCIECGKETFSHFESNEIEQMEPLNEETMLLLNKRSKGYFLFPDQSSINTIISSKVQPKMSATELKRRLVNRGGSEEPPVPSRFGFNVSVIKGKTYVSYNGPSSIRRFKYDFEKKGLLFNQFNPSKSTLFALDEYVDGTHREIFTWFFQKMNQTFPLIDEILFYASLQDAIEGGELGQYISVPLINSIMCLFFLFRSDLTEYEKYKALTLQQVEQEIHLQRDFRVASIQTILILSIIDMTVGDEKQASQWMAKAVPLVYHLGLNSDHKELVDKGILTPREVCLRQNVFRCCFLTDRINSTILGFPCYFATDLKGANINGVGDTKYTHDLMFKELIVFDESIKFYEMEVKIIKQCFDKKLTSVEESSIEKFLNDQNLCVSSSILASSHWKKNMDSNARFRNNKSFPSLFLEISRLSLTILTYKSMMIVPCPSKSSTDQFLSEINEYGEFSLSDNDEDIYRYSRECSNDLTSTGIGSSDGDFSDNSLECISLTSFDCSKKIIKLCLDFDLTENFYLYRVIYGLYMASLVCLYNFTYSDTNIQRSAVRYFKKGLILLQAYSKISNVSTIYIESLQNFGKEWFHPSVVENFFPPQ